MRAVIMMDCENLKSYAYQNSEHGESQRRFYAFFIHKKKGSFIWSWFSKPLSKPTETNDDQILQRSILMLHQATKS